MQEYRRYDEVTKQTLDTIKVGDMVKINDWNKPMKVRGVSENYFVMTQNNFGKTYYSVCEKKLLQPETYIHNRMVGGQFHCSTDNMIFGYVSKNYNTEKQYDFENIDWINEYLQAFENEEIKLSERHGVAIASVSVKSA